MSDDDAPQPEEPQIKWLQVFCPKCRAAPGQPCWDSDVTCSECHYIIRKSRNFYILHVLRVNLYEAFALKKVDEYGRGRAALPDKSAVSRE